MGDLYFDYHSATPVFPEVLEELQQNLRSCWGSTLSCHQSGQELMRQVTKHTESILSLLGADPTDQFYFFASHADAIEHLFFSYYLDQIRHTGKNHILTTAIQEAAILLSLKRLEELGCHGKMLPVDHQGILSISELEQALGPRSALLSLSVADGLTGVIQPIEEIAALCQAQGVALHVDGSYAIGKIPIEFHKWGLDFFTFDGSFIHAPRGTAGLIVKAKTGLAVPLSSTMGVPVPTLASLAKALQMTTKRLDEVQLETARLKIKFEEGVVKGCPQARILFSASHKLPNTATIAFEGIHSEALLFRLSRKRLHAAIGGGHCQKLSHVLHSCGVDPHLVHTALSFTFSFQTQERDVESAIDLVKEEVEHLSRYSSSFVGASS